MEDIWKEEAKLRNQLPVGATLDTRHRPVASCTVTHLSAAPCSSFNVKMASAPHKGAASAAPAASALISLAAARHTVTSCLSFPSSSGAFKGQLAAVSFWFCATERKPGLWGVV